MLPPLRRSLTGPKVAPLPIRANSSANLYPSKMKAELRSEQDLQAAAAKKMLRGNTDTILNQSDERIDRLREGLRTMFREHVPPQQQRKQPSFWRGRSLGGGGAPNALSLARGGKRVPPPPLQSNGGAEPMSLGPSADDDDADPAAAAPQQRLGGQIASSLRRMSRS